MEPICIRLVTEQSPYPYGDYQKCPRKHTGTWQSLNANLTGYICFLWGAWTRSYIESKFAASSCFCQTQFFPKIRQGNSLRRFFSSKNKHSFQDGLTHMWMRTQKWLAWLLSDAWLTWRWGGLVKKDPSVHTGSPCKHTGSPRMHTCEDPKKVQYGDSPYHAYSSCYYAGDWHIYLLNAVREVWTWSADYREGSQEL